MWRTEYPDNLNYLLQRYREGMEKWLPRWDWTDGTHEQWHHEQAGRLLGRVEELVTQVETLHAQTLGSPESFALYGEGMDGLARRNVDLDYCRAKTQELEDMIVSSYYHDKMLIAARTTHDIDAYLTNYERRFMRFVWEGYVEHIASDERGIAQSPDRHMGDSEREIMDRIVTMEEAIWNDKAAQLHQYLAGIPLAEVLHP